MIHLDTTFVVDYLRETRRRAEGPATRFLQRERTQRLAVSLYVVCELETGVSLSADPERERSRVDFLLDGLDVVVPGHDPFAGTFGRLSAALQAVGTPIGTMDLLIATTALVEQAPLVTRNERHFRRVPGLEVITYDA